MLSTLRKDGVCKFCESEHSQKLFNRQRSWVGVGIDVFVVGLMVFLTGIFVSFALKLNTETSTPEPPWAIYVFVWLAVAIWGLATVVFTCRLLIGTPYFLFKDKGGRVHLEDEYPVSIEPTCVRDHSTLADGTVVILRSGLLSWSGPLAPDGRKLREHGRVRVAGTHDGAFVLTFETKTLRFTGLSVDTLLRLARPSAERDAERSAQALLDYEETARFSTALSAQVAVLSAAMQEALLLTIRPDQEAFALEGPELLARALQVAFTPAELAAFTVTLDDNANPHVVALRERLEARTPRKGPLLEILEWRP